MMEEINSLKSQLEEAKKEAVTSQLEADRWQLKYFEITTRASTRGRADDEDGDELSDLDGEEDQNGIQQRWKNNMIELYRHVRENKKDGLERMLQRCPPLHRSLDMQRRTVLHHAAFKVCVCVLCVVCCVLCVVCCVLCVVCRVSCVVCCVFVFVYLCLCICVCVYFCDCVLYL
jgi:hypothetical protein